MPGHMVGTHAPAESSSHKTKHKRARHALLAAAEHQGSLAACHTKLATGVFGVMTYVAYYACSVAWINRINA